MTLDFSENNHKKWIKKSFKIFFTLWVIALISKLSVAAEIYSSLSNEEPSRVMINSNTKVDEERIELSSDKGNAIVIAGNEPYSRIISSEKKKSKSKKSMQKISYKKSPQNKKNNRFHYQENENAIESISAVKKEFGKN